MSDLYRALPSVPRILAHPALEGVPHDVAVGAAVYERAVEKGIGRVLPL